MNATHETRYEYVRRHVPEASVAHVPREGFVVTDVFGLPISDSCTTSEEAVRSATARVYQFLKRVRESRARDE